MVVGCRVPPSKNAPFGLSRLSACAIIAQEITTTRGKTMKQKPGPKVENEALRRKPTNVAMDALTKQKAAEIGKGNVSEGVRKAVWEYRDER